MDENYRYILKNRREGIESMRNHQQMEEERLCHPRALT